MLRKNSQDMHGQDENTSSEETRSKPEKRLSWNHCRYSAECALYTGAAALTAYSLWSSWGQPADGRLRDIIRCRPQPDMGFPISERSSSSKGKESRAPPGGLEEPPPPYYEDQSVTSHHQRPYQTLPQQPSTPQSQSIRTRKVFVSSQRNRRRPTFQGTKTSRQNTPKKGLLMPSAVQQELTRQPSTQVTNQVSLLQAVLNGTMAKAITTMVTTRRRRRGRRR